MEIRVRLDLCLAVAAMAWLATFAILQGLSWLSFPAAATAEPSDAPITPEGLSMLVLVISFAYIAAYGLWKGVPLYLHVGAVGVTVLWLLAGVVLPILARTQVIRMNPAFTYAVVPSVLFMGVALVLSARSDRRKRTVRPV